MGEKVEIIYYLTRPRVKKSRQDIGEWLIERAESGDSNIQLILGEYYQENGDFQEAFRWVLKAARQGDIKAQYRLRDLCIQEKESVANNVESK